MKFAVFGFSASFCASVDITTLACVAELRGCSKGPGRISDSRFTMRNIYTYCNLTLSRRVTRTTGYSWSQLWRPISLKRVIIRTSRSFFLKVD